MRYYCKNCGSEWKLGDVQPPAKSEALAFVWGILCPFCLESETAKGIPDYETPYQYHERTGEAWPNDSPVWYWTDQRKLWVTDSFLHVRVLNDSLQRKGIDLVDIVCPDGPKQPPDGWKPEAAE